MTKEFSFRVLFRKSDMTRNTAALLHRKLYSQLQDSAAVVAMTNVVLSDDTEPFVRYTFPIFSDYGWAAVSTGFGMFAAACQDAEIVRIPDPVSIELRLT